MIVAYIDAHKARFGVEPIRAVLSEHGMPIAPSTYYLHQARAAAGCPVSATALDEAHLVNTVVDLHRANWGVYGVRKMWHALRRAGLVIGRDKTARLMRTAGLTGAVRGRHRTTTTVREASAARHPDLVRRAWSAPTGPDQLWVADFTYVWTLTGFVYVAFVTDVFSRRILGWKVSSSRQTTLVHAVLQQALATRQRADSRFTATGLVHHSDAGSQYTSLAFTEALIEAGIAGSIGTVGDALDNALMESTIGLFKTELIDVQHCTWTSRSDVEWQTARWIHWYNGDRLHSSIGHLPPIEFEHLHQQAKSANADPAVA